MAKIITWDLESAPNVGLVWGIYDQNVPKIVQKGYVMGFAWKPLGKKVQSCYIWDFPLYKTDPTNDIEVIKRWIQVASMADVLVGHNSKSFDDKMMMAGVMRHRLQPPTPFQSFDTKTSIKQVAKFTSNKLDDLGDEFGIGRKLQTGGIELWWACMNGDKKAQKRMVSYNKQDVVLTEKLYLHERTYAKSHPALNVLDRKPDSCPRCGGAMELKNKYRATNTNLYAYYYCKECGGSAKSRIPEPKLPHERMKYV